MLQVDRDLFAEAQAGDREALERLLSIEDVVQEALIVVYRRIGSVRSPAAFGAWLVNSMRFAHVPVDQLRMDVARALAALPERYRQIILLRDMEELTIPEISRRLAISGEAAKSVLRRARAAARTLLMERAT